MGIIYLSTLIYLLVTFRKKIFYTLNKYLLLLFILIFSYIIPLAYGYFKTPILTDRYIIYVLIPILILISSLIFEVTSKKVKIFIFIFLLVPTIINNFMEIKDRKINKPEFKKFLNSLKKNDVKDITVNTNSAISKKASEIQAKLVENYIKNLKEFKKFLNSFEKNDVKNLTINTNSAKNEDASKMLAKLVENYVRTLNEFKNENFKIFNLNDVSVDQKMIWVVCYEPIVGFNCSLPDIKKDTWILLETKQNHFLNSRLYEIR